MKKLKSLKNGKVLETGSLKLIHGGLKRLLPEGVCSGSGTANDPYVLESVVIPSGSDGC